MANAAGSPTNFATPGNVPARGLGNHGGGVYSQSEMQDVIDADSMQGPITRLVGIAASPDVINPHIAGNYIIESTAVDPITLGLPFVGGPSSLQSNGAIGGDDGLSINVWSDTAFAHTVILPSAGFVNGTAAAHGTATFAAFRGAGMTLRAWNGTWQVISSQGVTLSA
jgi:hypothetical protein